MTDREAMERALAALELVTDLTNHDDAVYAAIDALRERLAQPERDWDWRHPKAQALIGAKARLEIKLRLVEQLVEDPNLETTASDMEYWEPLHDKLQERLAQPEQGPVAIDSAIWTPCMKLPVVVHVRQQRPGETHVSTREGITPVKPDDLIMRGVSGEEYPIGRAIFEQTYSLDTSPQPRKIGNTVHLSGEQMAELFPQPDTDYWQEEARRYAQNADFWRSKAERLAQPEQKQEPEPVGEMRLSEIIDGMVVPVVTTELPVGTKLYIAPPQRKPLTDEELDKLRQAAIRLNFVTLREFRLVARAIEAAHGIKGEE